MEVRNLRKQRTGAHQGKGRDGVVRAAEGSGQDQRPLRREKTADGIDAGNFQRFL